MDLHAEGMGGQWSEVLKGVKGQGSRGGGSWACAAGGGTENLGTPHLKTAGLSPPERLQQLPPLQTSASLQAPSAKPRPG